MTLQPPTPNIEPRAREELSPRRLAEIFKGIQQNFDFYNQIFPLQASNTALAPAARVYKSSPQSIPNAAATPLTFDTERFDTRELHSALNPTRLTAPIGGLYVITCSMSWAFVSAGTGRLLMMMLNGATSIAAERKVAAPSGEAEMGVTTAYPLEAGEFVEVHAFHATGGAVSTAANNLQQPQEFSMCLLSHL